MLQLAAHNAWPAAVCFRFRTCLCSRHKLWAGVTHALTAVFNADQRQQLLPFAPQMWTAASKLLDSRTAASSVTARKLAIKLVQRIGLTFLPATVASWRYQQTSISINVSLSDVALSSSQPAQAARTRAPTNEEEETARQGLRQGQQQTTQQQQQHADEQHVHSYRVARPVLQPSQFVNVAGPVSPSTGKQAGTGQAHAQPANFAASATTQPGSAWGDKALNSVQQTPVDEDDVEVLEEIEEVSNPIVCHTALLWNDQNMA